MISTLHAVCENPPLHEIHRSKISLHCAKADYSYPTIRLPHTLSTLAGLPTHIYQTVHQGALAFLVVVSSSNKSEEESPKKSENPAISLRPPPLHGEGRRFEFGRAHRLFYQSEATIKPEEDDVEYEELHNSDEKLRNFGPADNDESLARIMTDRYIDEEGNERIEMLWEELIPEEGDDGIEWDEKNDPYMLKAEARYREVVKRQREVEEEEEEAKDALGTT